MTDIKLEPLPWFAFYPADYLSGTMRLPTESHGAYILLMCDYYSKAAPCPDDDFILAAVTRLPLETWKKHRRILEPFFDIRDGHWFHERIEHELLQACLKHAASSEKARNAALARHEKRRAERGIPAETAAKPARSARSKPRAAPEHAPSMPQAVLGATQPQPHNTTPYSRSIGDDATTKAVEKVSEEDSIGTQIDPQFQPNEEGLARCDADGASADEIASEIRLFIAYNDDRGSFSTDWNKTWALWWSRYVARRPKQAPARIEVNNKPYVPTAAELERALSFFARGGSWSSKAFGPEPGHLGCRVPVALIEKHGIDPKTGFKRRTEPVT